MVDVRKTWDYIYVPKDETDRYVKSPKPVPVRGRRTVYVKDNSVSHSFSRYLMGRRRDNGKVFARWQTESMSVVRRTSKGRVAFMTRTPLGVHGGFEHSTSPVEFNDDGISEFYRSALKEQLGISTMADVYPVLSHFETFGNDEFQHAGLFIDLIAPMRINAARLPAVKAKDDGSFRWNFTGKGRQPQTPFDAAKSRVIYGALHNDDPTDMVYLLTGHEYRKDISRALRKVSAHGIGSIHELVAVERDLVAKAIEVETASGDCVYGRRAVLQGMYAENNISRHAFLRLFEEEGPGLWAYRDLRRMLNRQMSPRDARAFMRTRSVREAHDELALEANRIKSPEFADAIKYREPVAKINGAQVGKYTIVLPKNGNEIQTWGKQQGHCIGTYSHDAYKYAVLAAVHEDGKMVANFHLTEVIADPGVPIYRLNQIYGKRNAPFEGAQEVHDWLVKQRLIIESPNAGGLPVREVEWENVGHMRAGNINPNAINFERVDWGMIQPGNNLVIYGNANLRPIQRDPIFQGEI